MSRGDVVDIDRGHGPQCYVIVSNERRNLAGREYLAVMVTSKVKYAGRPMVVALTEAVSARSAKTVMPRPRAEGTTA